MKVIDFKTRKVIHEDSTTPSAKIPVSQTVENTVPIQTYDKGKFTLAIETSQQGRFLVIYNTSSKVEISRKKVTHEDIAEWMNWANVAVERFVSKNK